MSDYLSQYKAQQERLLNQLNADTSLLSAWLDDTLQPAIDIMKLKVSLSDLLAKLDAGQLTREVLKPALLELQKISQNLDKISTQNATAQIRLKHASIELAEKRFDRLPEYNIKGKVYTGPLLTPRIDNL